jgi:hypothetical protein
MAVTSEVRGLAFLYRHVRRSSGAHRFSQGDRAPPGLGREDIPEVFYVLEVGPDSANVGLREIRPPYWLFPPFGESRGPFREAQSPLLLRKNDVSATLVQRNKFDDCLAGEQNSNPQDPFGFRKGTPKYGTREIRPHNWLFSACWRFSGPFETSQSPLFPRKGGIMDVREYREK